MPPRELELRLEVEHYQPASLHTAQARQWEEKQSYVDTVLPVMRALALEEIPGGVPKVDMDSNKVPTSR